MKQKLFSIFCCLLLSASMVTQAQLQLDNLENRSNEKVGVLDQDNENLISGRKNAPQASDISFHCDYADVLQHQVAADGTFLWDDGSQFYNATTLMLTAKNSANEGMQLFFTREDVNYGVYDGGQCSNITGAYPDSYTLYLANSARICRYDVWERSTGSALVCYRQVDCGSGYSPRYPETPNYSYILYGGQQIKLRGNASTGGQVVVTKNNVGGIFIETVNCQDYDRTRNIYFTFGNRSENTINLGTGSMTLNSSLTMTATSGNNSANIKINSASTGSFDQSSFDMGNTSFTYNGSAVTIGKISATVSQSGSTYTIVATIRDNQENVYFVTLSAVAGGTEYTISTAVSPSNTYGTVSGAGSYTENSVITLTATSANEHLYIFDHWLKDGNNYAGGATITPTVTANATYTAIFRVAKAGKITAVPDDPLHGYVTGGSDEPYEGGTEVTLEAVAYEGWEFSGWDDGVYDNPRTVYVDDDAKYIANFDKVTIVEIYGAMYRDRDDYHQIIGTSASGYEVDIRILKGGTFEREYTTSDYYYEGMSKNGNNITVDMISDAIITLSNDEHVFEGYVQDDAEILYHVKMHFYKPLWMAFSWDDSNDVIVSNAWADGGDKCSSSWYPYGTKSGIVVEAGKQGYAENNYVCLYFITTHTKMYSNNKYGPETGTYNVQNPGQYDTSWEGKQCDKDGYDMRTNFHAFWTMSNDDVIVGYRADDYYEGACTFKSYWGDMGNDLKPYAKTYFGTSGSQINVYAEVEEGKDGKMFLKLFRKSDNALLITIGSASNAPVATTYDLAWDANGGELSGDYTAAGSVNAGATITAPTATRTGYTFTGWSPAFTGTMPSANTTYTAQWTPSTYTVTVAKSNNGYGTLTDESDNVRVINNVPYGATFTVEGNQITINGTTVTATPTTATAQYTYNFSGWKNGSTVLTGNSNTVTDDITIKANFTRVINTFTVTFEVNSTSAGYGLLKKDDETPTNQIIFSDVPYNTAKPASIDGKAFTFMGSTVTPIPAESAGGYTYSVGAWSSFPTGTIKSNKTAKINFTRTATEYTITYNNYDISTYPGTLTTIYTVETQTITLPFAPNVAKEGYTFAGWYDNEELTGTPVTSIAQGSTGNKEFWAKWEQNTYTVTIAVDETNNYGTVSATSIAGVPHGATITVSDNTITINGATVTATAADADDLFTYSFSAWKNGETTLTGNSNTVTEAMTITAHFARNLKDVITLNDMEDAEYYNNFATAYDSVEVGTVTYNRTFTANRWSTICLPFDAPLVSPLKGNIFEFLHATGNANVGGGIYLYFSTATQIVAGRAYLVRFGKAPVSNSYTFYDVEINTSADKNTLDALVAANTGEHANQTEGTISLIGTLRKFVLPTPSTNYMALYNNKIYYPGTNTTVPAYRAFFYDSNPSSVQQRVRIVVDGVDMGEMLIDNGELLDADKADDRAPRKYIRHGNLYIEREGVIYDAQGKRM